MPVISCLRQHDGPRSTKVRMATTSAALLEKVP